MHRLLRGPLHHPALPQPRLRVRRGNQRLPATVARATCSRRGETSFGAANGHGGNDFDDIFIADFLDFDLEEGIDCAHYAL